MVKMKEDETAIDVRQVDYSMVDSRLAASMVFCNVDWSVGGIVTHPLQTHPCGSLSGYTYKRMQMVNGRLYTLMQ